jgi:hypothetical protein
LGCREYGDRIGNHRPAMAQLPSPNHVGLELLLEAYLITVRDSLAERGQHINSRVVGQWIEECCQEQNGSTAGDTLRDHEVSDGHNWGIIKNEC